MSELCRGRNIALDIARGLTYLHNRNILHLDIKSPNILLTSSFDAKISDIGLGRVVDNGNAGPEGRPVAPPSFLCACLNESRQCL